MRYIDQKAILPPSGRSITYLVYKKTRLAICPSSRTPLMRLSHLGAHITCLIFRIKAFYINVKQKICIISFSCFHPTALFHKNETALPVEKRKTANHLCSSAKNREKTFPSVTGEGKLITQFYFPTQYEKTNRLL